MLQLVLPGPSGGARIYNPDHFKFGNSNLGAVISSLTPYLMGFAGLILFFSLIFGGFTLLTSAGDAEKVKKGQMFLTGALIGFMIIFLAYWIMQILQVVFNLKLGF